MPSEDKKYLRDLSLLDLCDKNSIAAVRVPFDMINNIIERKDILLIQKSFNVQSGQIQLFIFRLRCSKDVFYDLFILL